ncbi:hypothetical protein HDV02_001369 [Globomyces sp. JEL0801]|nr:hypothetical protein HDV02_001369 [Globomyces sp. JEL0801]
MHEKHWKDARDILDLFGLPASENSLTLEKFQTKCSNDRWLMNRIMLNPNMKVAKPSKEVVQKS